MEFTVEFYENQSGRCPVREFLDRLKESDPDDFAIVMAGLAKLRNRQYHKLPLSRPIGEDLFELRHLGKLNTRVLYFSQRNKGLLQSTGSGAKPKKSLNETLKLLWKEKRIGGQGDPYEEKH
jgi:putative component of toxin-antitoxin plasmid stabilization module